MDTTLTTPRFVNLTVKSFTDDNETHSTKGLVLQQTENEAIVLADTEAFDSETIEAVKQLSEEELNNGEAYNINPHLDEAIVIYSKVDDHWETLFGLKVFGLTNEEV